MDFLKLDSVLVFKNVDNVLVYSSDSEDCIKVYRDCCFGVDLDFFKIVH